MNGISVIPQLATLNVSHAISSSLLFFDLQIRAVRHYLQIVIDKVITRATARTRNHSIRVNILYAICYSFLSRDINADVWSIASVPYFATVLLIALLILIINIRTVAAKLSMAIWTRGLISKITT